MLFRKQGELNPFSQMMPYVVELVDMGVRFGEEYIVCEGVAGYRYELTLSGTSLDGYVYDYKRRRPGPFVDRCFVEIGRDTDGRHYIEMLFQESEFDALHEVTPSLASDAWKALHRVPAETGTWLPLYYGGVGVPLT